MIQQPSKALTKNSTQEKKGSEDNSTEKAKEPERNTSKPGFLKNPLSRKEKVVHFDKRDDGSLQTPVQMEAKTPRQRFSPNLVKKKSEKAISDHSNEIPKKQNTNLGRILEKKKPLENEQSQLNDLPKSLMKPESAEESTVNSFMTEVVESDPITGVLGDSHEYVETEGTLPDESLENVFDDQSEPVTQPEYHFLDSETMLEDPVEEISQSELHVASNPNFENDEPMENEHTGDQEELEVSQPPTVPVRIKKRQQPKVDSDRHPNNEVVVSEKHIPRKLSIAVRNKPKMSEAFRLAPSNPTPEYGRSRSDTHEEAEELRRQHYNRHRNQNKSGCDCGCHCDCQDEDNIRHTSSVQWPINVTPRYDSSGYYPVINGSLQISNGIPGDGRANRPCALKLELEFGNHCGRRPR